MTKLNDIQDRNDKEMDNLRERQLDQRQDIQKDHLRKENKADE